MALADSADDDATIETGATSVFADKLPDVANVILAGLVVGQALSERPFSPVLAVAGMGAWVLLMTLAVLFAASEEQS